MGTRMKKQGRIRPSTSVGQAASAATMIAAVCLVLSLPLGCLVLFTPLRALVSMLVLVFMAVGSFDYTANVRRRIVSF